MLSRMTFLNPSNNWQNISLCSRVTCCLLKIRANLLIQPLRNGVRPKKSQILSVHFCIDLIWSSATQEYRKCQNNGYNDSEIAIWMQIFVENEVLQLFGRDHCPPGSFLQMRIVSRMSHFRSSSLIRRLSRFSAILLPRNSWITSSSP